MLARRYAYTVAVICGLLAGTVFTAGLPGLFIPFLLLPLFFWAGKLKTFYLTACFFLAFHGVVLSWFLDVHVGALLGEDNAYTFGLMLVSWVFMTALLSACMLPLVYFAARLKPLSHKASLLNLLWVPAAWVLSEWFRSVIFGLVLYGNGGTIGDYWNFGSLGLGFMETTFGQLASFIGMYGLSFLAVLSSLIFGRLLVAKNHRVFGILLFALACFSIVLGHYSETPTTGAQTHAASVFQRKELIDEPTAEIPVQDFSESPKSLIILPEYSEVFYPGLDHIGKQYINGRLAHDGISIDVDEGQTGKWYGTLRFRDKNGQLVAERTKEFLIPTGEYTPFLVEGIFLATGQSKLSERFNTNRRVYKGEPPLVYEVKAFTVGPVACSGILGRTVYQSLVKQGAEVLTNSASLGDFNRSKSYFRQSVQMAKFHAVANGRFFIQSSRGAPAFVLNDAGDFVVKPGEHETKFIDFEFSALENKTLYTKVGEWVLVLSGVVIAALAARFLWLRLVRARDGKPNSG